MEIASEWSGIRDGPDVTRPLIRPLDTAKVVRLDQG
jgi:hypothetical protein